jgi:FlaA1/EpsC-like NDP-sugar epimerase
VEFTIKIVIIEKKGGIKMDWKQFLLTMIVLYVISFLAYTGAKKFILTRFKLKKKHLIIAMAGLLVIQTIITSILPKYLIIQFIFTILFIVAVLLFMDVLKQEREIKNRPIVGKPKPKPNRANKSN